MKALLLAAGEGRRLRPLTGKLPKPMIPIAGKAILEHNINLLARYGINQIAINLHYYPEVVMDYFGDGSGFGVSITYSYEPELLGTAGAVKKLENFFEDTFLVIYADNLIECDLSRLLLFHNEHQGIGTIALHYRDNVSQSGMVALDPCERIIHFIEKPQASQVISHWVNSGILVFEKGVLKYIPSRVPSDFGREIIPILLKQKEKLYGYRLRDDEEIWWIDTLEDLSHVQNAWKEVEK